jgi:hypothetical protein
MLLHLGHHAARHGNGRLKDATFALMKPFADLQVTPNEIQTHAASKTESRK